ncbi:thioredoxin family protein [Aquimarina rhabdastrellae]
MKIKAFLGILMIGMLMTHVIEAQESKEIQWITFEQLEDSLSVKPKKVFIDFYADWCVYCKKMDRVAFKKEQVINKIKEEYYAVKMDVETTDTIVFGQQQFVNKEHLSQRRAYHDIPLLLASRKDKPFSLPAIVILNENFTVKQRFFEYMDPKKLMKVL